MLVRSAGVLPYKIIDDEIYVYLEHPGGPFCAGKDIWSVCKGEYSNEAAIDAALREFKEESGMSLEKNELDYLYSCKVSNKKMVTMFIINKDLNPKNMKSNTFEVEYPKGSGEIKTFPEMDEAKWIPISEAEEKIFNNQKVFLKKLREYLDNKR